MAPVLFGEPPGSSPSDAGSGPEGSVDADLDSADSVLLASGLSVGSGEMVCVRADAPQAMYEKPASSFRAIMTVEQNWSFSLCQSFS